MNKHDVFRFTAPNGVEVVAVVLDIMKANITEDCLFNKYLCYAQNKLFSYYVTRRTVPVAIGKDEFGDDKFDYQEVYESQYGEVIVDYAILPDFDEQLRKFTLNEETMNTFSPDDYAPDDNLDS